jgi:spoIIIJ-associated protein
MSETRTVETTAHDIEEAIEAGLQELDVGRENVIVEILDEPSRGLLGIGARMARVRLTTAVPPRSTQESFQSSTITEEKPAPRPKQEAPHHSPSDDGDVNRIAMSPEEEDSLADDVRMGLATLRELLQRMNIDAQVTVEQAIETDSDDEDEHNPWILHVRGDDLGILIGHRGKTLSALQYLTRLIAGRDLQQRAEFVVDVENYKARREVLLRRLAQRLAKDAIRRRRTIEMEPMPPHERRIIHMELRGHSQVETESTGEGSRRRVTIVPKR